MEVAMQTGTLKELNVKPGDVVEWIFANGGADGTPYTVNDVKEEIVHLAWPNDLQGVHVARAYGRFRIISRAAQPTPDLTSITTPFGLLDEPTQEALRAHGGPYEAFGWVGFVACDPQWKNTITYRVKPYPVRKTVRTEANMTDSGLLTAAHYGHTRIPVRVVFETVDGVIDLSSYRVEPR